MNTYSLEYYGLRPSGLEMICEIVVSSPRPVPQENYVVWHCDVQATILGKKCDRVEIGVFSLEALSKGIASAIELEYSFICGATEEIYYGIDPNETPPLAENVERLRRHLDYSRQRRIRVLLEMALILSRPIPDPFEKV